MNRHENTNIEQFKPIISPSIIKDELPITDEIISSVIAYRNDIINILDNNDTRFIVISGPCSIHDYEAAVDYAQRLKEMSLSFPDVFIIMRVYFEKPRTNVGWKGLINDPDLDNSFSINKGIRMARKLLIEINKIGLPVGCEFLDTIIPQYISDLVSWGAIGARTVESQVHRELVSGLSMPVGFKNGTSGNIQVAIDAIISSQNKHCFLGITDEGTPAIITTKGNIYGHIVLRGGSSGPNYSTTHIKDTIDLLNIAKLEDRNIIVDCSHGNSQKKYENQVLVVDDIIQQISNGETRIKGIMLESHLIEGSQKITNKNDLIYGMSITDGCINLDTTKYIIEKVNHIIFSNNHK